ncbi:MAG: hypothetical protein KAI24_11410 [Planctomycetes bacterium]|nr:hypothetical protein [Planctomycetota bacterium]
MKTISRGLAVALALFAGGGAAAQKGDAKDDFERERRGKTAAAKDALEGKPAPALQVANWLNTDKNAPLDLKKLRGKVVVLKFWGVW